MACSLPPATLSLCASGGGQTVEDRRRASRYPINCLVSLSGPASGGASLANLSRRGCLITGHSPALTLGLQVQLSIHLPVIVLPLLVDVAVVRWIGEYQAGMEFLVMSLQEQSRLRFYLDTLAYQGA
ncbi:PilZ domain-containing protein [Candidatus Nitrospira bockiana]